MGKGKFSFKLATVKMATVKMGTIKLAILGAAFFGVQFEAKAGYWEVSGNGSYMKYNNGLIGGDPSYTIIQRSGGGLAYRFLTNTALEVNYAFSKTFDKFSQDSAELVEKYFVEKTTISKVLSLNLILDFAPKKAVFKPFIRGGGGYMVRSAKINATGFDKTTEVTRAITFSDQPESYSTSADAGMGFKYFVGDSLAIEFTGTVYASDLDKPEIYLHYSLTGGLRVLF